MLGILKKRKISQDRGEENEDSSLNMNGSTASSDLLLGSNKQL